MSQCKTQRNDVIGVPQSLIMDEFRLTSFTGDLSVLKQKDLKGHLKSILEIYYNFHNV